MFYLAFTEAWERFSFYGMGALLALYMVNQLLLPGHVEHVAGFATFRAALEGLFGPMSTQALAFQIFGTYAGFVYFTPVLGGLIADRWIGQRNAVVLGALTMSAGHLAMAFDTSFLIALLLLVTGSGLLKGNISAQVGSLYRSDDAAGRIRGFAIFSMSINAGALAGPILCGWLAGRFGWHVGFGAAAIFMLVGLVTYLVGYRHLPARVERSTVPPPPLTAHDWRIIALLGGVMLITMFQSIAYYQMANVFPVWVQQHVDLTPGGFRIHVPWYQSVDPLFSIIGVPVVFGLWRWQAGRGGEPGDLTKIGIGASIASAANLVLCLTIALTGGEHISPIWPFLYCAMLGTAFLFYWPTLMALVSRAAPPAVNATMMGISFLTLFIANNVIGRLGGSYEPLGPFNFWLLHAGIAATGALLVLVFGRSLGRALDAHVRSATQDIDR